jgi:hypothetical protein
MRCGHGDYELLTRPVIEDLGITILPKSLKTLVLHFNTLHTVQELIFEFCVPLYLFEFQRKVLSFIN